MFFCQIFTLGDHTSNDHRAATLKANYNQISSTAGYRVGRCDGGISAFWLAVRSACDLHLGDDLDLRLHRWKWRHSTTYVLSRCRCNRHNLPLKSNKTRVLWWVKPGVIFIFITLFLFHKRLPLTLSPSIPLRLYTLPYWSNPPPPERQSVRMSKIKNGGLDQYGAGPFEQQQFGTAGVEGANCWVVMHNFSLLISFMHFILYSAFCTSCTNF